MLTGTVTSATSDLTDATGKVILKLSKGDQLRICERAGSKLRAEKDKKLGFVPTASIAIDFKGETIPPEATAKDLKVAGGHCFGPEGWFCVHTKYKTWQGWKNSGVMTVSDFIDAYPAKIAKLSKSKIRVLKAASANEGNFEAINSYDNAFLSPGILQWTVGSGEGEGELAGLLDLLKSMEPGADTFNRYFGQHGLDVDMKPAVSGYVRTGFLVLNKKKLVTKADKDQMREPIWVYRFWRAAHDNVYRYCQFIHAVGRVDLFYQQPLAKPPGGTLRDFISTEHGVAQLLDQHTNRPAKSHTPGIMVGAINAFIKRTGKNNPATWTDSDEAEVIDSYLKARTLADPPPTMTHADTRGQAIKNLAAKGELSTNRGSFVP